MNGNTFVLIFTVYLISMAAAIALLTIVYITKPRPRGQPKRMSPEFPEHPDAGLLRPGKSLMGPSQTSKGDIKDDPGGEHHEETGKQTVSEAQIREVRVLRSPPAEHAPLKKQNLGAHTVGHGASELEPHTNAVARDRVSAGTLTPTEPSCGALVDPIESAPPLQPAQPVESASEGDGQGTPVAKIVAREEKSRVETVAGENAADVQSTRRKQSGMKMDFFGSRSKKQKQEAARTTQARPQKKEIRVDDSRRPRIGQPVTVSNRQPGTERLKSQSAIPSSQPVAGFKKETTSQEATVVTAKENAATGEVKPSSESTKAMIEAAPSPPALAPAVSGGAPTEQKGVAGEFSDLFARNSVEVTENNRLAEGMKEIDARDLLTEGLGLVARLKRPGK